MKLRILIIGLFVMASLVALKAVADHRGSGDWGGPHYKGGPGYGHHGYHRRHGRRGKKIRFLKRADANRDGIVTLEEVEKLREKRFNKYDTNNDGVISEKEIEDRIRARIEKRVKRMTRKFDRNKDGKITQDEFNWLVKEKFSWRDLNDDQKLSGDELPRRFHRFHERRGSHGGQETSGKKER